ncbi:MAG: hypothetical protein ACTS3T_00735 [Almyronema sp.]
MTSEAKSRSGVSFTIVAKPPTPADCTPSSPRPVALPGSVEPTRDRTTVDATTLPTVPVEGALPSLPKLKRTTFSSHRHEANPALAMTLLQEIGGNVEQWQTELRKILLDIQAVYMEGPIVDGWLESEASPTATPPAAGGLDASVLRHGDVDQIHTYIQAQIEKAAAQPVANASQPPQYRLCSLDAEGRLNCQPCPPEQLSVVSVAIARHQKIRQLLSQKQYLEARLKRAVEVLTTARSELGLGPSGATP